MISSVFNMFANRKRLDGLVWGSFSEATRARLELLYPDVPRFCSLGETIRLYIGFLFGLLPFMQSSSSLLCTVMIKDEWLTAFSKIGFKFPVSIIVHALLWLGPSFFSNLIENPLFVAHLKLRGLKVVFWTINDAHEARRAKRAGASGIITDFPAKQLHKNV